MSYAELFSGKIVNIPRQTRMWRCSTRRRPSVLFLRALMKCPLYRDTVLLGLRAGFEAGGEA